MTLTAEIVDRFGPLPPARHQPAARCAGSSCAARAIGIRRLDLGPQGGYALFEETNQVDPKAVIRLVQHPHGDDKGDYRLEGPLKLRISYETDEAERFEFAEKFLVSCVERRTSGAGRPRPGRLRAPRNPLELTCAMTSAAHAAPPCTASALALAVSAASQPGAPAQNRARPDRLHRSKSSSSATSAALGDPRTGAARPARSRPR